MTMETIDSTYQSIGMIADKFSFPKSTKSVTAYKKVIVVTTDPESNTASESLLNHLTDVCDRLPTLKNEIDEDTLSKWIENTEENLLKINKMFSTVENLFKSESDGQEVEIDDENMYHFLANMKKSQKCLQHISDHLILVQEVMAAEKELTEKGSFMTAEELINSFKAA